MARAAVTKSVKRLPKAGLGESRRAGPKIGLALAGGGPLGAIYEIGALCALEEALPDLDLNALDGYVGVSAGGFVAAGLANGMTPRQLCTAFIENGGPRADIVQPNLFIRPALTEYARRLAALPGLVAMAGFGFAFKGRTLLASLEHLGRALPTGLFSNAPLERQVRSLLSGPGRSNDFRQLSRRLVLVATDLDSGETAPFGLPGWDHVPISEAAAASAALPGLFPPVPIDGHWYVDGALKKTLHASVLLDLGLDLVLCLNPLVPFDATRARHRVLGGAEERIPRLVDGGLPVVLSQTFRTLIHSCCSSPTTATRRCFWPTPSATARGAGWPSTPTSAPVPTCARGVGCWVPCWPVTGWRWTAPCWTTPGARWSNAAARPAAPARRRRCAGWTRCWTTCSAAWRPGAEPQLLRSGDHRGLQTGLNPGARAADNGS
jgi:predicted acylesterase/phospholipase RssA